MIERRWIVRLLSGAIGLPIVLALLFLVKQLFAALHDPPAVHFLERCGTVLLLICGADLVLLVIATAVKSIENEE